MSELLVTANSVNVGTLSVYDGLWSFRYAETWGEWPLSPQFPLSQKSFTDQYDNRQVEWFFDNLLPEGRLRQLIAARERIDAADTWAFLLRHGQDMAGALSLQTVDDTAEATGKLVPLSIEELQAKILESHSRQLPLMAAWDEIRMSLAGAQEKLGLRINADGAFFLPKGDAASSHIVKPDNVSPDFPYCPANEFFCMSLAREMKFPVPEVHLLHLPSPLYCIRRYDRIENGLNIKKLHQIDLCQALGVPPSRKYESDGGLGLPELLSLLGGSQMERPIVAVHTALQWIIFNYMIGNLDAHAKNIAFLLQSPKIRVAPWYDLLSVEAYLPGQPMAMAIAGDNKPGWIEGIHWDALAVEAGVSPRHVRSMLETMQTSLLQAAARVLTDIRLLPNECAFIAEKVMPILEQRRGFIVDALKQKVNNRRQLVVCGELDEVVRERLARVKE